MYMYCVECVMCMVCVYVSEGFVLCLVCLECSCAFDFYVLRVILNYDEYEKYEVMLFVCMFDLMVDFVYCF